MKSQPPGVVVAMRPSSTDGRSGARAYGTAVDAHEVRAAMRRRGLTGAELARRAGVSPATISHALNGRRIHPVKLRAILGAIHAAEPLPSIDVLVVHEDETGDAGARR